MNIFSINAEIQKNLDEAIDQESGEIINEDALQRLQTLSDTKESLILDLAASIKNDEAEETAIKNTITDLKNRAVYASNRIERKKKLIRIFLSEGEKLKDGRVSLSWRRSESVNVSLVEIDSLKDDFIKIERSIKKEEIKKALKAGEDIPGAFIESKNNLVVK